MLIHLIKKSQLYFIFSFGLLIVFGTLVLKIPFAMRPEAGALSWVDAVFTATSAVCVTGLTTVPLSDMTFFGQMVVLFLIQLGGLGVMTLSTSILLALGRNMSIGTSMMFSTLNETVPFHHSESLVRTITTYTFGLEAAGTILLSIGFVLSGHSPLYAVYLGFFHSISAFCNAGFSTFDTSMIGQSAFVRIVIAMLILCGGLGMYVIYDLVQWCKSRKRLSVDTRLILVASAILVVGGTLGIKLLESGSGDGISYMDAFFQSVSARTAGFNSVDLNGLSQSCLTLLIILMLIGAAPGSTGGGIKLTGVALAVISIYNTFCGNQHVLLFKREIPISNVLKSFTMIITYVLLTLIGAMLLSVTLTDRMLSATFEAASAVGTVGLSLGVTAATSELGKITLIVLMFIGRIGPFTLFLFLMGREKASLLQYPEERVVIG